MSRDARRTRELDILRELCKGQLEGDVRDRLEVVLRDAGGDADPLADVGIDGGAGPIVADDAPGGRAS